MLRHFSVHSDDAIRPALVLAPCMLLNGHSRCERNGGEVAGISFPTILRFA